jgi:hypothetical protein
MATWLNTNASQGKFTNIAVITQIASVARVMPLPYRRLTRRWILVRTGVVELLTIILVVFIICQVNSQGQSREYILELYSQTT